MLEYETAPWRRELYMRYRTTLTHNSSGQYEFVLPPWAVSYHGFEHKDRVGYSFVRDGQTLSLRAERNADVPKPQSQSVAVRSGGQATLRIPVKLAQEQHFDKVLDSGGEVALVIDSREIGVFDISFAPPIEPVHAPTSFTASESSPVVANRGGKGGRYTSFRLFFPVSFTNRFGFDEGDPISFSLCFADGGLGLMIDLQSGADDQDSGTVYQLNRNKSDGRYYVTLPAQLVHLLNWDDTTLQLYAGQGEIVAVDK